MAKLSFVLIENQQYPELLPQLFHILHTNMSSLAPTGCTYEEDCNLWLSYILSELKWGNKQIMLMVLGDSVVGYAQYSITGDTLEMDEVEILPRYQRIKVFYRFCQHMIATLPEAVQFVSSYV